MHSKPGGLSQPPPHAGQGNLPPMSDRVKIDMKSKSKVNLELKCFLFFIFCRMKIEPKWVTKTYSQCEKPVQWNVFVFSYSGSFRSQSEKELNIRARVITLACAPVQRRCVSRILSWQSDSEEVSHASCKWKFIYVILTVPLHLIFADVLNCTLILLFS